MLDMITLMMMMILMVMMTAMIMLMMLMMIPITKGGMRVMRAAASCHQLSTAPRLSRKVRL